MGFREWWSARKIRAEDNRRAREGLKAFQTLPAKRRRVVFYAESAADWAHLGAIWDALRRRGENPVAVCSDPHDPILQNAGEAFYVGMQLARTILFRTLQAKVFVLTLPDLQTFHLKRSVYPVHYMYVFHSIASLHRVYREHAFDAYDDIFCVGPHHEREMRRAEELYGLGPHRLIPHGYARLDRLVAEVADAVPPQPLPDGKLRVLLAPTWGECSIIEHGIRPLISALLDAGHHVTLRLHPMTKRHMPGLSAELAAEFLASGRFAVDPVTSATQALLDADIMISEWSGSILEYAFARLRPVLSIDTPPKIHNENWRDFRLPCLEDDIRTKIGALLSPADIGKAPEVVAELVAHAEDWAESIRALREQSVFNLGRSGEVAADVVLEALKR